jgi:hypothetical protein
VYKNSRLEQLFGGIYLHISLFYHTFAAEYYKLMTPISVLQTQFASLAIGATAKHMGITTTELFNRLKRHGLVKKLLFDCYDTLHSESIEGVVWNVQEALKNWDNKKGK